MEGKKNLTSMNDTVCDTVRPKYFNYFPTYSSLNASEIQGYNVCNFINK